MSVRPSVIIVSCDKTDILRDISLTQPENSIIQLGVLLDAAFILIIKGKTASRWRNTYRRPYLRLQYLGGQQDLNCDCPRVDYVLFKESDCRSFACCLRPIKEYRMSLFVCQWVHSSVWSLGFSEAAFSKWCPKSAQLKLFFLRTSLTEILELLCLC